MEDFREATPASHPPHHHPLLIGTFAIPGALAGGALALLMSRAWGKGRLPDELALFAGAFAGAFVSLRLIQWIVSRALQVSERVPAPGGEVPERSSGRFDPGGGWLHVVCGPDVTRVARGVATLAARFLSRRERVLLVDGGCDGALHAWLGGVPHLGLVECLNDRLPVLGLVQAAPVPGVYLLARGGSPLACDWSQLGRVLDQAHAHFRNVVLAMDPVTLGRVATVLSDRPSAGWWASEDRARRIPEPLRSGFPIPLYHLRLDELPNVTPETLRRALAAAAVAPDPAPSTRPHGRFSGSTRAAPAPAVLDCDLQVRERLRFLMWMKRVQAEGRGEVQEPLSER